jgi:RimJ/RimL family protein N-acetyltransferase
MITVTCTDPKKGDTEYHISPLIFSPENLNLFWKKSSKFPTLFNAEVRADFNKFLDIFAGQDSGGKIFAKGLFFRIDTEEEPMVGVFYMTDIDLPTEATVHFSFFDGRIRGRIPLAKKMLEYVFKTYDFNRLNAALPVYVVPAAFHFVEGIGFQKEGRKRRAVSFDNKFFDVILYGILKEEVTLGS